MNAFAGSTPSTSPGVAPPPSAVRASSSSATALKRSGASRIPLASASACDGLVRHRLRSGNAANIFSTFSTKRTVASSIWSR